MCLLHSNVFLVLVTFTGHLDERNLLGFLRILKAYPFCLYLRNVDSLPGAFAGNVDSFLERWESNMPLTWECGLCFFK